MLSQCDDCYAATWSWWVLGAVIGGPAVCEGMKAAHSEGFEQSIGSRALLHRRLDPGSVLS